MGHTIFCQTFANEKELVPLLEFPYIRLIKPGIERFTGTKKYLATADVNGPYVNMNPSLIDYESRENRANMKPRYNSVWFAKMKNSIKHIFLPD